MKHFNYRTHVSTDTIEFVGDCWEDGGVRCDDSGNPKADVNGSTLAHAAVREIVADDAQLLIEAFAGEGGISSSAEWRQFAEYLSGEVGLSDDTIDQILASAGAKLSTHKRQSRQDQTP